MTPTILEHFINSKSGHLPLCEDGLFMSPHYIAIVDGVTGKGSLKWPPSSPAMTSGVYAKTILLQALSRMPETFNAREAIVFLNNALAAASLPRHLSLQAQPEERLQAVIILYSCARREIWAFGDCQCMIDSALFTHSKEIDELIAQVRCLYDRIELILGASREELTLHDTGREAILPLLKRQMVLTNADIPYGYDVLDGFLIHPERTVIHPVKEGSQVILASDGYPLLKNTLADSEKALAELLQKDPLCLEQIQSTKGLLKGNISFDDRTYVRFQV